MNTYFEQSLKTIGSSLDSMDNGIFEELVNECISVLDNGHKIIASGLGKNVPICDKFVGTMLSMGQNANFMHTSSAVHGDIGMVESGDLVIILTKSGETVESIYLTDLLLKRETNLWLLSFSRKSTLTEKIEKCLILDLEHEGDPWNIVPNNSSTVNLVILQGLAMEIITQRGVTLPQFKRNHPGGHIGEILKNV